MRERLAAELLVLAASISGCTAVDDVVFDVLAVEVPAEPLVLREGAGVVELPVRLNRAPSQALSARYRLLEREAQSGCQLPDFLALDGSMTWSAGERETLVSVWIGDDTLAEIDEHFVLEIEGSGTQPGLGEESLPLVIVDDDRTGLVDASELGVNPGRGRDQSEVLQQALDAARELGRGVVVMPPGEYDLSGVELWPGTSLSARGARWYRPARSSAKNVGIRVEHAGPSESSDTLIEGVALLGQRDAQGAYQNDELAEAHLIALHGSSEQEGRLRVAVQSVELEAGTASGVFLGPQVDAALCRVRGTDLWRDLVTLRGGGSRVDARELDASASVGTTGLWFDGQPAGHDGTHRIDVTLVDVQLASGDLEIEAYAGSHVEIERLSMTKGPLRLHAPDASVRISDSLLQLGIPSASHNYFGVPHDVEVRRTTLVASETDATGVELDDVDRQLSAALVRWEVPEVPVDLPGLLPFAPGPHRLVFDGCTFSSASDVEATDRVYAVETEGMGGELVIRAPLLGADVLEPFAPGCSGCTLE